MQLDIKHVQERISYQFRNPDLLQQAFTRRSYSEENGSENNEVLEFIGDSALSLVIVRILTDTFGEYTPDEEWNEFRCRHGYSEGRFTELKKALVEKKALAKSMDTLGFQKYLIMGKGDATSGGNKQDSVKEDLFEAIIGAVALDCDFDINTLTEVVDNMIDFDSFFKSNTVPQMNAIALLQQFMLKHWNTEPEYEFLNDYDGITCRVKVPQSTYSVYLLEGRGTNKSSARMRAAEEAIVFLRGSGQLLDPLHEAIGKPIWEESVRQLHELFQKKLISEPKYIFGSKPEYDSNGNPVWSCELSLDEIEENWYLPGYTKKQAKQNCAYAALL